ncbi:UNVERIFIED_CONTAM: hypothetical protein K2H54_037468 [Gekko kuhli]
MALRFRTLLPFAIPGVLALIGWWWFSSRKKERPSNHDRQDFAGLEECRIGSPKAGPGSREDPVPCSREDAQSGSKLTLPAEREEPSAKAGLTPSRSPPARTASPEQGAQSFDSSGDLAVPAGTTPESDTVQDDSTKLDSVVVSQGVCGFPAGEPSLATQTASDSLGPGVAAGDKRGSSLVGSQLPLVEAPCLEESLGNGLEKKRTGDLSLDKEEVEKIEQVAIHIISQVILAATEEVLSSSVSDRTDRLCQMAAGHIDRPLEKVSSGAVSQAEPTKNHDCLSEKKAAGPAPPLDEKAHHHTTFSSHLMHGLLANPSHSRPRDSTRAEPPAGEAAVVANHTEELKDVPAEAEVSGCSSEEAVSREDLLKNGSSSISRQRVDSLDVSTARATEHSAVPSKKPPSPGLPENRVPYSNGVLREDCLDLRHEQPWPAEVDADHSGGEG